MKIKLKKITAIAAIFFVILMSLNTRTYAAIANNNASSITITTSIVYNRSSSTLANSATINITAVSNDSSGTQFPSVSTIYVNDSSINTSSVTNGKKGSYTVSSNGTYKITAECYYGTAAKNINVQVTGIGSYSDGTAPTITLTATPTTITDSVSITATATDSSSGVAGIKMSGDSSYTSSSSITRTVTSNGSYTFYAKDKAGNVSSKSITISNIDTEKPTISNIKYDNTGVLSKGIISFSASDTGSGVNKVIINGKNLNLTEDGKYSYEVTANDNYIIKVIDKAGNESSKTVAVTNIDTSKPKVATTVSDYSNGKAKVTIKATPQGAAKIKSYSYAFKSKVSTFALNETENEAITGSGDNITINVNDETYVEGSFTTESGMVSTFTVDGYDIIVNEAIHEDNWLNNYVANSLGKKVSDLTIDDIESITEINAPNQGITEIPYSMKYMSSLEKVDLSNNNLTEIPEFVEYLTELKELNMSGNYNLDKSTIPVTSAKVYNPVSSEVTSKDKVSTSGDFDVTFSQENTIELTLSTNEISFGDINGITESENTTPSKLVINVQSSLIYDLNINAETDFIGQTDSSNIIPIEKLQYNVNSNDYVSMAKDTTAIASDKAATLGNKDSYSIDFKLQPTIGYAKDSYKTNIKVTALQK